MSIDLLNAVFNHSRYSGTKLNIMLTLANYADENGNSFPSYARIAFLTRTTERNVIRTISAMLEDDNPELVVLENGGGRNRTNDWHITLNDENYNLKKREFEPKKKKKRRKPTTNPDANVTLYNAKNPDNFGTQNDGKTAKNPDVSAQNPDASVTISPKMTENVTFFPKNTENVTPKNPDVFAQQQKQPINPDVSAQNPDIFGINPDASVTRSESIDPKGLIQRLVGWLLTTQPTNRPTDQPTNDPVIEWNFSNTFQAVWGEQPIGQWQTLIRKWEKRVPLLSWVYFLVEARREESMYHTGFARSVLERVEREGVTLIEFEDKYKKMCEKEGIDYEPSYRKTKTAANAGAGRGTQQTTINSEYAAYY